MARRFQTLTILACSVLAVLAACSRHQSERRTVLESELSPLAAKIRGYSVDCNERRLEDACRSFQHYATPCLERKNWPSEDCKALREYQDFHRPVSDARVAQAVELVKKECDAGDDKACLRWKCGEAAKPDSPNEDLQACARGRKYNFGKTWAEVNRYSMSPGGGFGSTVYCFEPVDSYDLWGHPDRFRPQFIITSSGEAGIPKPPFNVETFLRLAKNPEGGFATFEKAAAAGCDTVARQIEEEDDKLP